MTRVSDICLLREVRHGFHCPHETKSTQWQCQRWLHSWESELLAGSSALLHHTVLKLLQGKVSDRWWISEDHKWYDSQKKRDTAALLNCSTCIRTVILGVLCTHVTSSWVLQLPCRSHTFLLHCHVRCRVTGLWHWHMSCCLGSCWVWQSWVMPGWTQTVNLWCAQ